MRSKALPNAPRPRETGFALILAISMLAIMAALGVAYVTYMRAVWREAEYDLREDRGRVAAEAACQAGLARVVAHLEAGEPLPFGELRFDFPYYVPDATAEGGIAASDRYRVETTVRLSDEFARVNVNRAPPRLLQAILGISPQAAREVRSSIAGSEGPGWLATPAELTQRGVPVDAVEAALPYLTAYSLPSPEMAVAYINVNTAPPAVLAAALNLSPEAAGQLAGQRPFASLEAMVEAGRLDPSAFNVSEADGALRVDSRSVRLDCESRIIDAGVEGREEVVADYRIDTVAYVDPQGTIRTTYWDEGLPARDDTPAL